MVVKDILYLVLQYAIANAVRSSFVCPCSIHAVLHGFYFFQLAHLLMQTMHHTISPRLYSRIRRRLRLPWARIKEWKYDALTSTSYFIPRIKSSRAVKSRITFICMKYNTHLKPTLLLDIFQLFFETLSILNSQLWVLTFTLIWGELSGVSSSLSATVSWIIHCEFRPAHTFAHIKKQVPT